MLMLVLLFAESNHTNLCVSAWKVSAEMQLMWTQRLRQGTVFKDKKEYTQVVLKQMFIGYRDSCRWLSLGDDILSSADCKTVFGNLL
jgi:hypothetical protein